jgi:hypothetical protein
MRETGAGIYQGPMKLEHRRRLEDHSYLRDPAWIRKETDQSE